jgi:ABC-type ATPase with predicted acetyltransferase domain
VTKYTIDIRFHSSVERTPRVLEVAEGFGLGLSAKEFVIYDNLELEINQGDVVYVTGQSGSGKSLILQRADAPDARQPGGGRADRRRPQRDRAAGEAGHRDRRQDHHPRRGSFGQGRDLGRLDLHSQAERAVRRPALPAEARHADGQQRHVWMADEFGAVLDRVTAKCVAFNMQKVARALGKTLIVATTHTDLIEELGPSLTITKRFRQRVDIQNKEQGDA